MDPQHASQQPSSFTLYDGYCLPLTNGHRSTPLLHMSIDESTHKALGKVWSLTTLLVLVSRLMLVIHTGKGHFIKLNGSQQINISNILGLVQ